VTIPVRPANTPTPTPVPPKPDKKPPTVSIVEGTYFVTTRRNLMLHAEAADNRAVAGVEFSVGADKRYRPADKGDGNWGIRVLLKERLTYVRVRARDTSGNISKPFQTVIFRSGR
jgi:hypothetical protein